MSYKHCECCYEQGYEEGLEEGYQEANDEHSYELEHKKFDFRDDGRQLFIFEAGHTFSFNGETAEIRMGRGVYFLIQNNLWGR